MQRLFVLSEHVLHAVGGHAAVDLLTDFDDGGQTTGTDATEAGQGELAVGSDLTDANAQLTLQFVQHLLGTTHVASGTQADADRVLALRGHGEEGIERNDAVDSRNRDAQLLGHQLLDLAGR